MSLIIHPKTTAVEDMRLMELKKKFRQVLGNLILDGMRRARDGRLELNMAEIENFLNQAYIMGREDAS